MRDFLPNGLTQIPIVFKTTPPNTRDEMFKNFSTTLFHHLLRYVRLTIVNIYYFTYLCKRNFVL